mgnify:CR=1 FL=1
MIKTKSVYHDPIEPQDGFRLLVMRYWPRGVSKAKVDLWFRDLGPEPALLDAYRKGRTDWETFSAGYREQVTNSQDGQKRLSEVERLEETHGTVTLLCHENLATPDARCHRMILKEVLDSR